MAELAGFNVGQWVPAIAPPQFSPFSIGMMLFAVVVGIFLLMLWRMSRYRILIEVLEYVNKGYVSKKLRYRKAIDKHNNMIYLQPMSGNLRISNFPNECFTKMFSMPLIGTKRFLSLIRINQHSFTVFMPPEPGSNLGTIRTFDTRSWLHAEQIRKVNKALKKGNFLELMSILAPTIIVVGLIVLLLVGIFMPITFYQYLTKKADAITAALLEIIKKKWGI